MMDSIGLAFEALGKSDLLGRIVSTFDLIEIASGEIDFAKQRHPDRAEDIDNQFLALSQGSEMFNGKLDLYRAHCREWLEDYANHRDRDATRAQLLVILSQMSNVAPLNSTATWAYAECFDYVYRRLLGRKVLHDIDPVEMIRSVRGMTHVDEKNAFLTSLGRRIKSSTPPIQGG